MNQPRVNAIIAFMAVAGGLAAANLQWAQPLIPSIAASLGVDEGSASLLVAAAQVGFIVGLAVVVPRTLRWAPRWSVSAMFALASGCLLAVCATGQFAFAFAANIVLGFACVAPQMLTPLAASLAEPARAGRAAARVLTGILVGGLCARVTAGVVAQFFGWRSVYAAAAVLTALFALSAVFALAPLAPGDRSAGRHVVRRILEVWARFPAIRSRALIGLSAAGAMSAFWATYAAQLSSLGAGPAVAGAVGVAAIGGTVTTPWGGAMVDRDRFGVAVATGLVVLCGGFAVATVAAETVAGIAVGAVLVSGGGALVHSSCLSSVLRSRDGEGHVRNSAYMIAFFCGAAAGTGIAAALYTLGGWGAATTTGFVFVATSALAATLTAVRPRTAALETGKPQ